LPRARDGGIDPQERFANAVAFQPDGFHPNALGAGILAELVFRAWSEP